MRQRLKVGATVELFDGSLIVTATLEKRVVVRVVGRGQPRVVNVAEKVILRTPQGKVAISRRPDPRNDNEINFVAEKIIDPRSLYEGVRRHRPKIRGGEAEERDLERAQE
jgi:hypothetical protein